MKSIVYKPLITKIQDPVSNTTPVKYTGYTPQYNWGPSKTQPTSSQETQQEEQQETTSNIKWEDPSTITWPTSNRYSNPSTPKSSTPKGNHIYDAQDVGEMQGFLDALANAGISVRVTSGNRPGAKTSSGNPSWHGTGKALDIVPVSGSTEKDFENLRQAIRNSPELIKYMQDNNLGILDESIDHNLKKTKGTGAHFHIGPDQSAIKGLQAILNGETYLAKHGCKIPILNGYSFRKYK